MATLTLRLEAYAKEARQLITAAQALADERQHPEVEPVHLLYRLVERDVPTQQAIARAGVDPTDVLVEAEVWLRRMVKLPDAVAYMSPRMLDLLGRAEGEGARQGGQAVASAQLLLACAQESTGAVPQVLKACGLSAPVLRASLAEPGGNGGSGQSAGTVAASPSSGATPAGALRPQPSATPVSARQPQTGGDALEKFGRDLVRMASQGLFDPAVGRDAELRRVIQVLARRRDNNPLLVGEPGIGKTTIVEALAARIARRDVPQMLADKRIVRIETSALIAGAKLRGEAEERMRALLDAVRDAGGQVILFLSDIGALVGERGPQGAADLLAGALGRGEVRCIAVATPDDVRKAFDSDSALARRFVAIAVEPPTAEEALGVLRGVASRYETAHGVRISDPALVAAVQLAKRYVPATQLPRSAIDLIDEAAARVRVETEGTPAELDMIERRLENVDVQRASLEDDADAASRASLDKLAAEGTDLKTRATALRARWQGELEKLTEARRLRTELEAAQREEEMSRAAKDEKRAAELRFGSIPLLTKQLEAAQAKLREGGPTLVHDVVSPEDVAEVVATWTGVPVAKMMEGEAEKLLKMETRLGARVIGQQAAVLAVSKAVRRGRVGLRDPRKPIGSFLFLGPTGVGKTELAKALAEFLFDDESSLTRLDMSEFMEKHTVARLLGAPPGYVDSDEGGYLTEAVRRKPYSVVLFDEVEKGHPDVFNILLQVLDDGRLSDSRGRLAHFSDTVIILTSNVGGHAILDHDGDAQSLRDKVQVELRKHFRPEFLNRIDDVIIFDRLSKEDLRGIVDIQLKGLAKLLAERRIGLEVSDAAKTYLVDLGYEPAFGARPLKRVILKNLQDPLAEEVLRGGYEGGNTVKVDCEGEGEARRFTFARV